MIKFLISILRWKARRRTPRAAALNDARSLVVVELTRLGDCITVLPIVAEFCRRIPAATIHVVVDEAHASLFSLVDGKIDVIGIRGSESFTGFIMAILAVRRCAPDLVCSMSPSNRNAASALLSGAPAIAGYLQGTKSYTPFLDVNPVEFIGLPQGETLTYGGENITMRPLKVLEVVGGEAGTGARIPSIARGPRSNGLMNGRRYIVLHPFSRWEYRSWPVGEFAALAKMIVEGTRCDAVFICHTSENGQLQPLRAALKGEDNVRFFPSADVLESAALIRDADLFVGNDSGPIHLAAYFDTPVVGLYGPATPSLAAPLHARGTFLYHPVPCSPCPQMVCVMPENHCMRLITAGEVFSAILKELSLQTSSGIPANA